VRTPETTNSVTGSSLPEAGISRRDQDSFPGTACLPSTSPMEESPTAVQAVQILSDFVECKGSMLSSQESATGSEPRPDELNPRR
jgi:hypothetical protein